MLNKETIGPGCLLDKIDTLHKKCRVQTADKLGLPQEKQQIGIGLSKIQHFHTKHNEAVSSLKTASFLAFHEVELYRTLVRRRIQIHQISLRFSASVRLDDFVIKLYPAQKVQGTFLVFNCSFAAENFFNCFAVKFRFTFVGVKTIYFLLHIVKLSVAKTHVVRSVHDCICKTFYSF